MSTEVTPQMQARQRVLWLTDHPGCTVEDYDRVSAPSPRKAAQRREHKEYLNWYNDPRVMRIIGLPPQPAWVAIFKAAQQQKSS